MKKAVVTGGTGFIGSWLIEELLANQVMVLALVRDKNRLLPEFLENPLFAFAECDLETEQEALAPYEDSGYDVFYHLAWGGVSPEHKNEIKTQLQNVSLSIAAIQVCRRLGCKKMIGIGTVAEYVFCEDVMDVNARQTPNDMYGAAKVSAHYFLEVLAKQYGLPFLWTVIPSTFGERRLDSNIITYTIRALLHGEKPRYGNLEQMWDFLYVSDVVRALRLIGEKGKPGKTYGIGSGIFKPLKEYIVSIRDSIDPSLPLGIGELPAMSGQTTSSCVNIYDLIRDTGFSPRVSFEEGIRRTVRFLREEHSGDMSRTF